MNPVQKKIEQFFHRFEQDFNEVLSGNEAGIESLARAFSGSFVMAGRGGINCGKNNEAFHFHLSKGFKYYRKSGLTGMKIGSITTFILDDQHVLARIHWKSNFSKRRDKDPVEYDACYLLQLKNETLHIFAYINGNELIAPVETGFGQKHALETKNQ